MFIEVILPVPLADTYTYSVPPEMQNLIAPGLLVLVEFGKNKHYSGVVASIHQIPVVSKYEIKPILVIESTSPILRHPQLRFWEWLSQYYICKQGEIYKAVLPSGFRTESTVQYIPKKETYVKLTTPYLEEENLSAAFESLKKAPKQECLLLAYLEYSQVFSNHENKEISQKELLEKSKSTSI